MPGSGSDLRESTTPADCELSGSNQTNCLRFLKCVFSPTGGRLPRPTSCPKPARKGTDMHVLLIEHDRANCGLVSAGDRERAR